MSKIITAAQAAEFVKDGCTLTTTGFNGFGCPEDLIMSLAEHFDQTGHPKDVTLVKCTSQGDGEGRGVSHLAAKDGLFKELILTHMGYDPGLRELVQGEKVTCYMLPLGNMMQLFRAIAGGLPGAIATTGIGTFADPRNGGGKANQKTLDSGKNVVLLLKLDGKECLYYPSFPIDVCFIRATYGDEAGNLSIVNEAMNVEQFEVAAAVHNSGGIVIAQVDKIVRRGTIPAKEVLIHGFMVDYLVEGRPEYSKQSFETDQFRPEIAGLAVTPAAGFEPLAMGPRKICCRRAAMELRPNSLINLGIGMPGGIGSVADEEGISHLFTLSMECGPLGGIPLGGIDFGAAVNPEAMYRMADILQIYDGGALDMAVLGFAEADRQGNVNAHNFHGRTVGPGGFIDITQNAKKLCFIGTFTAGKQEVGLKDDGLVIHTQGPQKKFIQKVESITFSGVEALRKGQEVLYITERAVFRLEKGGLTLIEIARGVDLQNDILDQMEFTPVVPDDLRIMDRRLFREGPMGLNPENVEKLGPAYEFWRDLRTKKDNEN
ncbi:MAG: 3-oxoacid CoA-transferase [Ruminiclostridium sp.]|nr:3-oxoacid CoA-transferase [Ruminiclostridium sp.]